jgi:Fur family ferric uptake transcriptional regulator
MKKSKPSTETTDLKEAGLKVTHPRIKILSILESIDNKHLSAEDVYKHLIDEGEKISIATVYRVLMQFEAAGLVKRHNFESGHSVYELDSGSHHDHMVCVRCGQVDEFYDQTIEKHQESIAKKLGYEITDHSLYIYGVCPDCRKK